MDSYSFVVNTRVHALEQLNTIVLFLNTNVLFSNTNDLQSDLQDFVSILKTQYFSAIYSLISSVIYEIKTWCFR